MARVKLGLYNAHLWGRTGMDGETQTHFVHRDFERAPLIGDMFKRSGADLIGITELFDESMARSMAASVSDVFPYHAMGPFHRGIPDVQRAVATHLTPWLYRRLPTERLTNQIGDQHYGGEEAFWLGAMTLILGEDNFYNLSHILLGRELCWGAGLMLLSRHPLENVTFIPFPLSIT